MVVDPYELLKRHTIDLFNKTNSNISYENYLIAEGAPLPWHMRDYNSRN